MNGIATLILVHVAIPGAAIGFTIAVIRRSSIAGVIADVVLGAAGGVAGCVVSMRLLARMNVIGSADGAWVIWLASAAGAVLTIAAVRTIARALVGQTGKETAV